MNNQNNEQEINRKRKNNMSENFRTQHENLRVVEEEDKNDLLTLRLTSFRPTTRPRKQSPERNQSNLPVGLPSFPSPPLPMPQSSTLYLPPVTVLSSPPVPIEPVRGSLRKRRNPSKANNKDGNNEIIHPPFLWATNRRATVHTLDYLLTKKIITISGEVQCKRCERKYQMDFDLKEKFLEIGTYIAENKSAMHDRAPDIWMNPLLPTCQFCKQENSVKPILSRDRSSINWLFLLLGRMLGCCTLDELKYFCEHTKNHRTGAKDRVLYLTYLTLCKQLDPNGPFDR